MPERPKLFGFKLNHTSAVLLFLFSVFLMVTALVSMINIGWEYPATFIIYLCLFILAAYILMKTLITRSAMSQ